MVQRLKKLNNATVKSLGRGKHSDGGGLWIYKTSDGGAKWVLRYSLYGRRHEMGLGGYPAVSLKEARESAEKWNAVVRGGKDAIKERERERREAERNLHILNDIAADAGRGRSDDGRADLVLVHRALLKEAALLGAGGLRHGAEAAVDA